MKRKDKEQVLSIIYDCIVKPEIDEGDRALVDYRRAKMMIAAIEEEEEDPNPYNSVLQMLRDFDLEKEWDGDIEELAEYICQLFKRGPYAKTEVAKMIRKKAKKTEQEMSFETKKELAIAAIQALYNGVPEYRKLRAALAWAATVLDKAQPEDNR